MNYWILGTGETCRVLLTNMISQKPDEFTTEGSGFLGLVVDPQFMEEPSWLMDLKIHSSKKRVIPFMKIMVNPHDLRLGIYLPIYDNNLREEKFSQAKSFNLTPLTFIDSRAMVDDFTEIGEGSWIQASCTIQTGTKLGKSVICWSNCHLGHKCEIGNFNFISSNSTICGGVVSKDRCYFGVNSAAKENITIESDTVLGMGAMLGKSVTNRGTVFLAGYNNRKV